MHDQVELDSYQAKEMKRQVDLLKFLPSSKRKEDKDDSSASLELDNNRIEVQQPSPGPTAAQLPEANERVVTTEEIGPEQRTTVSPTNACNSACCTNLKAPNQPMHQSFLATTKQKVGNKDEYRSLNPKWYKDFKWLHVCEARKRVFCYYCLVAYLQKTLTATPRHYETAFISEGFQNWKKATERFRFHEESDLHKDALFKFNSSQHPTITQQLSTVAAKETAENRKMLLKVLSSLRFLLKQGLPIRGHTSAVGNLYQLLELRSEDCPLLSRCLRSQHYMSPVIINEMIKLMGNDLLRNLLVRIREAEWFAILADETADIANHEQLSFSIRWVTHDYEIHEDFIGLVHVPRITSDVITSAIKDILIRCALPLSQCRGQAYDGAANMMGHLKGVATQIKKDEPRAISVHCFAHCLNLCLQDVTKKTSSVRSALDLIWEISKLIQYSPKRTAIFEQCKKDLALAGTGLRPLCPTRWTVRTEAINAVLRNYPALLEALNQVRESPDDYGRRAGGILAQLEQFATYFGLKLSFLVFGATEQSSRALQSKNTTISEALDAVRMSQSFLSRQRTDSAFDIFYSATVDEAQQYTGAPVLPRYRQPPRQVDSGTAPHRFASPSDYFRAQYFEVLDLLSAEITRRFDQKSLALPLAVEELLLSAANSTEEDLVTVPQVLHAYSSDLNIKKLERQIGMLPDLVSTFAAKQNLKKLKVTNVRTIAEMLRNVSTAQEMFSEVHKLVKLYFTIPITTATAERSFSVLRRIKTYLRSTMTEERLNNVILLHCHKDLSSNINLTEIAKLFIAANSRRQGYFGSIC